MARLTADQWCAIRQVWEFDPGEPTYAEAAGRAAEKHGFKAPSKQAIGNRVRKEKWERRGSLAGINQAAHRIADRIGDEAERKPGVKGGGVAYDAPGTRPDGLSAEYEERHESERKRAEIRVRHRKEWEQVASLRQEALKHRKEDQSQAFFGLKIAKITAETTAIQQSGECKAWGMDEMIDADRLKNLSDSQLESLISGKKVL